jgi:thermostable 8-oxoguanine DNA glycosylase
MKVLLDIPDKNADALMEVLRHISFVKAVPLTEKKSELLLEIREAVNEIKQIKAGEKSSRSARDFLDEN